MNKIVYIPDGAAQKQALSQDNFDAGRTKFALRRFLKLKSLKSGSGRFYCNR